MTQAAVAIDHEDRGLASVFSAYIITSTLWLLFATGVGLVLAFKFGAPEFGSGAWLTFGRLRPIHTNATFYGFASLALVGLAYYVAARSSGARLYSARLAWIGLALFNLAALAGTVVWFKQAGLWLALVAGPLGVLVLLVPWLAWRVIAARRIAAAEGRRRK